MPGHDCLIHNRNANPQAALKALSGSIARNERQIVIEQGKNQIVEWPEILRPDRSKKGRDR